MGYLFVSFLSLLLNVTVDHISVIHVYVSGNKQNQALSLFPRQ